MTVERARRSLSRGPKHKRFERFNNPLYVATNIRKGAVKGLASDCSGFVERYCEQKLFLHLHYCGRGLAGMAKLNLREYCATFYHAGRSHIKAVQPCSGKKIRDVHGNRVRSPSGQMDISMLVNIRHLVNDPEGVTCRILPSVVRLQTLHDCLSVWRDAPDLITRDGLPLRGRMKLSRLSKMGNSVVRSLTNVAGSRL